MSKVIKTVLKVAVAEYEEKKSKFIANVSLVRSEDDAVKIIQKIRSKYWDATHNVYAYCIGGISVIQRYSDDGEPTGTAGLPILEIIKKNDLQDVLVVVTRYFGGTMLGTGGLVRAYSKSAIIGLEEAQIVEKVHCRIINLKFDYNQLGRIQTVISERKVLTVRSNYSECVEFEIYIPKDEDNAFVEDVVNQTNGNVEIEFGDFLYALRNKENILIKMED